MEIKTIPSSVWIFLWHYFSRQKLLFFANLGAIIAGEFLVRLSLYYAAEIVGVISAGIDRAEALKQALALVVIASALLLLKSLAQNMICFLEARFMPNCVANVAKDLFDYAHRHSTAFFAEEMAGNISGKTKTIIDSIYPMYYNLVWGFLTPLSAMLITIGFVLKVNPVLALLLLALNLAVIYVIYRLSRGMVPVSEKRAQTMSEANGVLVDSITNAGLVKNFANYRFERRHYFKFMKTAAGGNQKIRRNFYLAEPVSRLGAGFVLCAAGVVLVYRSNQRCRFCAFAVADCDFKQHFQHVVHEFYAVFQSLRQHPRRIETAVQTLRCQ